MRIIFVPKGGNTVGLGKKAGYFPGDSVLLSIRYQPGKLSINTDKATAEEKKRIVTKGRKQGMQRGTKSHTAKQALSGRRRGH